jgi:hypothetical protein
MAVVTQMSKSLHLRLTKKDVVAVSAMERVGWMGVLDYGET